MFSLPFSMICSIALRYLIWKALRVLMISAISFISMPTSTSAWKSMSIDSLVLLCIATCSIERANYSPISTSTIIAFCTLNAYHFHVDAPVPQLTVCFLLELFSQFCRVLHNDLKQMLSEKPAHSCCGHRNDAFLGTAAQFVREFDSICHSVKDHHFQLHLNIVLAAHHLTELERLCLEIHCDH